MPASFNKETKILTTLLILAFGFYVAAFYLLRHGQGRSFREIDLQIFVGYLLGILIASLVFFTKNRVLRVAGFITGIGLALLMFFPFAFICFDSCPDNSRLIWIFVVASSFIYAGVLIWSMFKNKIVRNIILVVASLFYFLLLLTATPFQN